MKFKSIRLKIALFAGLCLLSSVGALVVYGLISSKNTQDLVSQRVSSLIETNTLKGLQALAGEQAGTIQAKFNEAFDAARGAAHTFEAALEKGGRYGASMGLRRDQVNAVLLNVLRKNPEINGIYSAWEPNALNERDDEFKVDQEGNNSATGRFAPYWSRTGDGGFAVEALADDYNAPDSDKYPNGVQKNIWYVEPRDERKENAMDPLPYTVQGKEVLLTAFSVPVIANGRFYGVVGTDYWLDFVQSLAESVDESLYNGQGEVAIISNIGLMVADSKNPGMVGKHLKTAMSEEWQSALSTVQSGKPMTRYNEATRQVETFAPINLGRSKTPWAVLIRVDKDVILAEANALNQELIARGKSNVLWQLGVGGVVTLLAILLLWIAAGGIANPVRLAADLADAIRDGDFSKRLNLRKADEVGQLTDTLDAMAQSLETKVQLADEISKGNLDIAVPLTSDKDQLGLALQRMTDNLNHVLRRIQLSGEQIASGSAQVASSSQTLSQGATESAASLEEISSSMQELGTQTRHNAENAGQANSLSKDAMHAATQGNKLMEELVTAMAEIDQSGQEINKIIKVIDEIAFQTNLLALNAAVEAARAGQHGKGFAVVAEEVRNLAARSARAAKETEQLIEGSAVKTKNGSDIADKTAEALKGISTGATRVCELVGEIAVASKEQSVGIEQINVGLRQIDQVTQQNTANAEEGAAASEELSSQAVQLHQMMARFTLRKTKGQATLNPSGGQSAVSQSDEDLMLTF